jgi:hypothetical protein
MFQRHQPKQPLSGKIFANAETIGLAIPIISGKPSLTGLCGNKNKRKMPLTRSKIIGYDQKSMVYRFLMMHGNQPIDCSVSIAVFKHLEKSRYPSDNMEALFLRWRKTIEKAISDKFDAGGAHDVASVHLFLKDVNRR